MDFNLIESEHVQATLLLQAEAEVRELEQLHMALVGGGCGEVVVG